MAFYLPIVLGVVAVLFVVIVSAEVFYLVYWRKRAASRPRMNVTVAPVNETEQVEVNNRAPASVVIDVTCAEYQINTLQQELVEKLFPSLNGVPYDTSYHSLIGPPRMLFTIKEETREELESLDIDCKKGVVMSKKSSRSKSMGDIPVSPTSSSPHSASGTPFVTPCSSPDAFCTPCDTPARSFSLLLPLSSQSQPHFYSENLSPLKKASCKIMCDFPNGVSIAVPPMAPPSPTRPSFSFLASRNVQSKIASVDAWAKAASPDAKGSSPGRKPLFQHLGMASPNRTVKATEYLQHDSDEDGQSSQSCSPGSSPSRSPEFFSTPSPAFQPVSFPGHLEMSLPSYLQSFFSNEQVYGDLSPIHCGSNAGSTYASPLLIFPANNDGKEGQVGHGDVPA